MGSKKLIFAGISLEVCAAFPAITAIDKGFDASEAVDASGTFSETKRQVGLQRMLQAGVIVSDYTTLMVEILKDHARPEALRRGCSRLVRFALFVEGRTQRALRSFLTHWLDPQLSHPVGVEPVRLSGSSKYLKSFGQRAKRDLDSGRQMCLGKTELERRVGDSRFRQHFAVHEAEAWLLADPCVFRASLQTCVQKLARGRNRSTSSNHHRSDSRRSTEPRDLTIRK